jgi:dihydrolipoamide dehydrogenase (EC 1.8.1.4)
VKVGADLRTDDTNILAIGDVIGKPMLAHKAIRQGVVAAEIAAGQATRYENKVVPAVVFSTPEIAIAGSIAQTEGVKVTKFPLSALGRAIRP